MVEVTEALSLFGEFVWLWVKIWWITFHSLYRLIFPVEPKDVNGEIVLITGAGHGMGREVATRFANLGAIVICVDLNPKGNEETLKMIKGAGKKGYAFQCDVTNKEALTQLAEKVRKEVGDVTILINNAGIMPCKSLFSHTEQDIRAVVDVNLVGILFMIQAFLPAMIKKNHGHLVSMSSMAGLLGARNIVPYCGTKYGVRGIMEALAFELDDMKEDTSGIKLTTIYPYIVDTGLAKKPRLRFKKLLKLLEPADAADQIVDAVRRELFEASLPRDMYYQNKVLRNFPFVAQKSLHQFVDASLDSHE